MNSNTETKQEFSGYAVVPDRAEPQCEHHFLTFKGWTKGNKHRIYVADYKGRTIAFIEGNRVNMIDNYGKSQDAVEYSLNQFMTTFLLPKYETEYIPGCESASEYDTNASLHIRKKVIDQILPRIKKEKQQAALDLIYSKNVDFWLNNENEVLYPNVSAAWNFIKQHEV